jgi:hypothetical protein
MGPTGRKRSEPEIQTLRGEPCKYFVLDEMSDTAEGNPPVIVDLGPRFAGLESLPRELADRLKEWKGDVDYSIFEKLAINHPIPPAEPIFPVEFLQSHPPCEHIALEKEPEKNPHEDCYGTDEYSVGLALTAYGKACKRKANKAERQRKKKARKRNRKR